MVADNPKNETLPEIIGNAARNVYENFPNQHGKLLNLFLETLERALYRMAYQFCNGSKEMLQRVVGQNTIKMREKCKLYNVINLGTHPTNPGWLNIYFQIYPIVGNEGTLENIMCHVEHDIAMRIYLCFREINLKNIYKFYYVVQEEIEIPLLVFAYSRSRGNNETTAKLLGICRQTLAKKTEKYGLRKKRNK